MMLMTSRWRGVAPALVLLGAVALAPVASAAPPAEAPPTCAGETATVYGASSGPDDPLVGTAGDDVMVVTGDLTGVEGLGGDDLICGGDGYDTIDGGPGDDTIHGLGDYAVDEEDGSTSYWTDVIDGGPGSDHLDVGGAGGAVSYATEPAGVTVTLAADGSGTAVTTTGTDTIAPGHAGVVGSPFADHLGGGPGRDGLDGGPGNDVVSGGAGDDDLSGGEGNDLVHGGPGDDRVVDGHAVTFRGHDLDVLRGDQGDDVLQPETGRDAVRGGAGDDTLDLGLIGSLSAGTVVEGDRGDDVFLHVSLHPGLTLDGEQGHDTVHTLFVGARHGTRGASRRPVVDLARGRYSVAPGSTSVRLEGFEKAVLEQLGPLRRPGLFVGSPRADVVVSRLDAPLVAHAGAGDDVLRGSGRADLLDGGPGRDVAFGGGGLDRCPHDERRSSCERR